MNVKPLYPTEETKNMFSYCPMKYEQAIIVVVATMESYFYAKFLLIEN